MAKRSVDGADLALPSDTQICSQCGQAMETRSWHNWINMGKGPEEAVLQQWQHKSGVWISHDCLYRGSGGLFVPSCFSCMSVIDHSLQESLTADTAPVEDTIMQSLLKEQIQCKMQLISFALGRVPAGRTKVTVSSSSSKRNKVDNSST